MRKLLILINTLIIVTSLSILPCFAKDNSLLFNQDELRFIENHPIIRVGIDPVFLPFEFIDKDGQYKGIASEYIQLIRDKTGLQFHLMEGLTWPEAYDEAIKGNIDLLPAVSKTPEREEIFLFSDAYYYIKRVIVVADTEDGIAGIEDLKGYTVAVQRNSSYHSYLLSFPNINLSLYESVEAALTAVANRTEKAYVGNLATTNYIIKANGLTNLKFTAFEAEKQQALHIAVRKDWPELVSIINKALSTVTEEEKIAINNKWIDLETQTNYGPIIRILLIIGMLVAIVLGVSFYWISLLRKEVEMRKQIQMDLEKAKKEAEDANNFKTNFLVRMSHEVRTPLHAITGMSYLLKKTNVTLTQKMYIDRITQASTNMLGIINDILDFFKIEAGKVELEFVSFNIDQIIQNVVNVISYKIEEQKIGFKLSKDPLIPTWFFGDAKRIEQVLLNLLNNAVKFTPSGEVCFDIRLVAKEGDKYHLSFTIKDSGIGMSQEQIKDIFDPFTQGDISINRRFGGTGLGLSIVKNLVDMMEGQINVYSTEGEGSTFVINVSFEIDKIKEIEYKNNIYVNHFKNVRTLVLEKTGSNMNMIESYLGAFGMHCELTTSQSSAVNMLQATNGKFVNTFDLLIIDYDTPVEGGFKFIEDLKNNKNIINIPKIIMLMPMLRDDLFDQLDEYGIDIGIEKPIIPSILFNGILEIFKLKAVLANEPSENLDEDNLILEGRHCALVVDDNKTNQLITKSLLNQIGVDVLLASDGKHGLDLYIENQMDIDLILMDLHMPMMNGYEASLEIRKISQDVPIVAMTADLIMGVMEKCKEYGIYHYISKPFDPDRFIRIIKDIIIENKKHKNSETDIIDRNVGFHNMGGNEELYEKVLVEYYNENLNTVEELEQAIREKRYSDAVQIVHKVKGSSGSIGAMTFYELCVKIQKALEDNNEKDIKRLHKDFNKQLNQLISVIKKP